MPQQTNQGPQPLCTLSPATWRSCPAWWWPGRLTHREKALQDGLAGPVWRVGQDHDGLLICLPTNESEDSPDLQGAQRGFSNVLGHREAQDFAGVLSLHTQSKLSLREQLASTFRRQHIDPQIGQLGTLLCPVTMSGAHIKLFLPTAVSGATLQHSTAAGPAAGQVCVKQSGLAERWAGPPLVPLDAAGHGPAHGAGC